MWRRISAAHEASVAKAMEGRFMDCTEPSPVFRKVRNRKRNRIRTFGDLRQSTVIRQHKRGVRERVESALTRRATSTPTRPASSLVRHRARYAPTSTALRSHAPASQMQKVLPEAKAGEQALRLPVPISYGNHNRPPQPRIQPSTKNPEPCQKDLPS